MSYIWSTDSNHISAMKFGLDLAKGNDYVEGKIYKVDSQFIKKFVEKKMFNYEEEECDVLFKSY